MTSRNPGNFTDFGGFQLSKQETQNESDPWSDKTWGKNGLNASFESDTDIFEFSATSSIQGQGEFDFDNTSSLFAPDEIEQDKKESSIQRIQVAIHEQVSALYNNNSSDDPVCTVQGLIHVKPIQQTSAPFCLLVRDLMSLIDQFNIRQEVCQDVSQKVSRQNLHHTDRVLRVTLPPNAKETAVATYTCISDLKPVPLLVKSRVQNSDNITRVGFKIRANPSNEGPLQRLVVMMAVPPFIAGHTVKMSRRGGVWDEMKRTLTWLVDRLDPGEALEIQAQFEANTTSNQPAQFPVLVRGDYPTLFSTVELREDFHDALSSPFKMELRESSRVLHRKV